jgi:polyhydroxybutyrate depolymerase
MLIGIQTAAAQLLKRPAPSADELAALGLQERTLQVAGERRWFLVMAPADRSRPAPVIVLLHGGTQSMRRLFRRQSRASRVWLEIARSNNALLLVPNGTSIATGNPAGNNQSWNDLRLGTRTAKGDDVAFISALVAWGHGAYRTDRSRVYVTGASNGGMMTYRLLIERPELFAAGAAFIAALPAERARLSKPAFPTPLMIVNGTQDPLVKWEGGPVGLFPGLRGDVMSTPDTVAWWVAANRAARTPDSKTLLPDQYPTDGCRIERHTHLARAGGAPVLFYAMLGGGHASPSPKYGYDRIPALRRLLGPPCKDAEGAELAWAFLSRHRRQQ